jgi:hypothetical protein
MCARQEYKVFCFFSSSLACTASWNYSDGKGHKVMILHLQQTGSVCTLSSIQTWVCFARGGGGDEHWIAVIDRDVLQVGSHNQHEDVGHKDISWSKMSTKMSAFCFRQLKNHRFETMWRNNFSNSRTPTMHIESLKISAITVMGRSKDASNLAETCSQWPAAVHAKRPIYKNYAEIRGKNTVTWWAPASLQKTHSKERGHYRFSNTGTQFRRAPHYSPELHSFRKIRPAHSCGWCTKR